MREKAGKKIFFIFILSSFLFSCAIFGEEEREYIDTSSYATSNDMLQAASLKNIRQLVVVCTACHSFIKGEPNYGGPSGKIYIGPNLYGVFGRKQASKEGYQYSAAFKNLRKNKKVWNVEELDIYLRSPNRYAYRTRMAYYGLTDPQNRMDVIAFLMTLKDSPKRNKTTKVNK